VSLATIERVEIVGLKSSDGVQSLGPRTLVTGEVGSGKSRIADALRFVALGYVPAQGKREADTARLMRGGLMRVTVTLADGRQFWRALRRKGQGYTAEAGASWMPVDAKPSEISEAIRGLFGASDLEAEECIDLRALLAASPNERARRIEAILDATAMTREQQRDLLGALPVFRLSGLPQERIPALPSAAAEVAASVAQTLDGAQRGALASACARAQGTLDRQGLAEALAEAGRMKADEREKVRGKQQARKEIEDRRGQAPSVTLADLAQQRQQRTDRLAEIRAQVRAHTEATRARESAEAAARAAREALAELVKDGAPDERAAALRSQAEALAAQAAALIEPDPVPAPVVVEEDGAVIEQAMQLADEARDLEDAAAKQESPPPVAPRLAAVPAVNRAPLLLAEERLRLAKASPWHEVRSHAGTVRSLTVPGEQAEVRDAVAASLEGLAARHGGTTVAQAEQAVYAAQHAVEEAEELAAGVQQANEQAQADHAKAMAAWDASQARARDLRAQARDLRTKALALRDADKRRTDAANAERRAAYAQACGARAAEADRVSRERRRLQAESAQAARAASDLLQTWTARAAGVAEAEARLDGLAVAAPLDADGAARETADLERQVVSIDEQRRAVEAADARARELGALAQELDAAMAASDAWAAVEWALQQIRARDLSARGGPLVERMHAFLRAAGRSEVPFLRAGKGRVDFGWRRGDVEIPIEALSGGETVLATTALAGAILALRKPALRVLLVEAAELGLDHAGSLMAGCDALAGDVGTALVASCLPVAPRDGWTHIEVTAAHAATAGAAA